MGKITKTYTLTTEHTENQKLICRECSRETSHSIIATYSENGSEEVYGPNTVDWNIQNQIIQCLGCETVSFRVLSTNSEDYDIDEDGMYYNENIKFYPSRSEGLKEINVYMLPYNVQCIYKETILAIENEQNVLAGIGVRALIETICKDQEAEGRDLNQKINSLQKKSILTIEGAETLHKLRALGNEAAHEVKAQNKQQLQLAIKIIEHMLDGTYIIPQKVSQVFK